MLITDCLCSQKSSLNSIDLSGNDLGEEDANALRDALEQNASVVCLDLRANQVRSAANHVCKAPPSRTFFLCVLVQPTLKKEDGSAIESMLDIEQLVRRNELDMRR